MADVVSSWWKGGGAVWLEFDALDKLERLRLGMTKSSESLEVGSRLSSSSKSAHHTRNCDGPQSSH